MFWAHIKKLGPHKNTKIPMCVRVGDNIDTDTDRVLKTWENDFSSLYNQFDVTGFDDVFLANAKMIVRSNEQDMQKSSHKSNSMLNREIDYDEVLKCARKLKVQKAVGIDSIPNELLKQSGVHILLYKLFDLFKCGIMPTMWLKGIITPIPKGAGKDPYVPLNFRGITLLSCVVKVYTSMLNNRILAYCDTLHLLVDEQNGFRKKRACIDHIFTLSSVIKNRLNEKLSTFCAFIDMQKAFHCIDRDLLLYSLLL